jgi:hypothetical protein
MLTYPPNPRTNDLGVVTALLGLAPAGTALLAALLRAALGRAPGRLPLAALLGGRLPARRTSLGRHGAIDWRLRMRDNFCELGNREMSTETPP